MDTLASPRLRIAVLLFAAAPAAFARTGYSLFGKAGTPSLLALSSAKDLSLGVTAGSLPAEETQRFQLDPAVFATAVEPIPRTAEDAPRLGPLFGSPPSILETKTLLLTIGSAAIMPVMGSIFWWSDNHAPWHVYHEGFFGENTYAGGADKTSHFYITYVATRLLAKSFTDFGHSPAEARSLAFAIGAFSGLSVEIGDGFSSFGFSPEDFAADFAGALAGVGMNAWNLDDTLGIRTGFASASHPGSAVPIENAGPDYSKEVRLVDFKFAGALRRLSIRPGIARFFLVSMTYGTYNYGFTGSLDRQRNVGVQLGLNMPEVLESLGVSESTWWGSPLLAFFKYVQVPYTAFGWAYDLNHGVWHGPNPWGRRAP